ncbi:MAG: DUF547 domain-containing protein [Candidatus Hodarchaeales archaeon]|jgi:hypothetical protein
MYRDTWILKKIVEWEKTDLSNYSKKEKFAFWLNAYNLFTLKGVLIEFEKNPKWNGNTSYYSKVKFFFLRKFIIAGKKINLRDLENKILRKQFEDPRLHFAINCASFSCPFLPGRLFQAETLDDYLTQLTRDFINNPTNVLFNTREQVVKLSMIFKWYKKDFEPRGGILSFIQKYHNSVPEGLSGFKIEYFKYNWELNKQAATTSSLTLKI